MKRHSVKLKATYPGSKRGSFILEAVFAAAIAAILTVIVLYAIRIQAAGVQHSVNLPSMNSFVDMEISSFRADPFALPPNLNPSVVGRTDTGESIRAVRSAILDTQLGVRGYTVSMFADNPKQYTLGGATRLEPLSTPEIRPVPSGNSGETIHELTLASSHLIKGTVSGGGLFAFGSTVPVKATPKPGRTFVNWTGTAHVADPNSASTTVLLDEDRTLTANFAP